jgi:hypothetical protein
MSYQAYCHYGRDGYREYYGPAHGSYLDWYQVDETQTGNDVLENLADNSQQ